MFVNGIVLAAGGSRRVGRPKLLLPLRGATLLDATVTLARGCGSSLRTAVNRVDGRADGVVVLLADQSDVQIDVDAWEDYEALLAAEVGSR
ncbi:MAG: molybdenum cofactor cytidylyltransferase [Pseudonocardiales bacterium]|nr:molybdenum cofactor cytidylyltransferase [Pseudonocardiales bacterium]